jgi:hypothetical protein
MTYSDSTYPADRPGSMATGSAGFEGIDFLALLVAAIMILGPLAGAAFIVGRHATGT